MPHFIIFSITLSLSSPITCPIIHDSSLQLILIQVSYYGLAVAQPGWPDFKDHFKMAAPINVLAFSRHHIIAGEEILAYIKQLIKLVSVCSSNRNVL